MAHDNADPTSLEDLSNFRHPRLFAALRSAKSASLLESTPQPFYSNCIAAAASQLMPQAMSDDRAAGEAQPVKRRLRGKQAAPAYNPPAEDRAPPEEETEVRRRQPAEAGAKSRGRASSAAQQLVESRL